MKLEKFKQLKVGDKIKWVGFAVGEITRNRLEYDSRHPGEVCNINNESEYATVHFGGGDCYFIHRSQIICKIVEKKKPQIGTLTFDVKCDCPKLDMLGYGWVHDPKIPSGKYIRAISKTVEKAKSSSHTFGDELYEIFGRRVK